MEKFCKKLSFIIPCYYSEKTVKFVVDDIFSAFPQEQYEYEIVLVNDGSKDNTYEVIKELSKIHSNVVAVNLSKNFGQDGARMAGYSVCTGDYIISLDDDGQNPPMEAHKLIAKIEDGYDVVFGKYHVKKHSKFKNFGSKVNDIMANIMLGKPHDLTLCSYFIMNRFVVDEILKYQGAFPYIWGLILRVTDNAANEYITHKEREVGETTYTFSKLLGLWLNGFTSFSVKPLRVASLIGTIVAVIGMIITIIIVIQKLCMDIPVAGWTSMISVSLLLGGLQLVMIGLLGEYVGRIFLNGNKAPQFVIKNISKEENER